MKTLLITRHYFLFTLLIALIFIFSCSEDKPNEPENESPTDADYTLVTSKTVGAEGGDIIADELTLTIPQGAFNLSTEINIHASEIDKPFDEKHISKTYKISGLPIVYAVPLEISIKYSDVSNTHSLILGQETFVEGDIRTTYSHIDAIDTNNVLICNLPVPQNKNLLEKLSDENKRDLIILKVDGLSIITSQNHFAIFVQTYADVNSIIKLGDYLEEAYQKVLTLGLNYSERTNWPVKVLVRDLGDEVDAYTSCSWFGNNHGYLEFNTSLMNNLNDLRLTAGHEFFHLIQYLYDTRSGITKSGWASMHHWVNEATAAWFEEKFTEESNFISSNIMGVSQYSLDGMQLSPYDNDGKKIENLMSKCYGRGPIFKYLVNRYGEEKKIIAKIFNDIKSGRHPVEAVCQYDPKDWWVDFVRQLITGNVYRKIPGGEWIGSNVRSSIFQINSENDLSHSFISDYKDLSSKILFVRLAFPEISSESKAIFKISGAEKRNLLLFSFDNPSKQVSYIGSDYNEVTVNDLRTLTTNSKNLLAVVTNNRYTSPYTWDNEISLEVKIKKEEEPLEIVDGNYAISISRKLVFNLHEEISGNDGSLESSDYTQTTYYNGTKSGEVSNGIFINIHDDDTTKITFGNGFKTANYFLASHYWSGFNNTFTTFMLDIRSIPLTSSNPTYQVNGSDLANYISYADYTRTESWLDGEIWYTKKVTTTGINYDDNSKIYISIFKLP